MKSGADTVYTCSLCGKEVDFTKIRYGADGKKLICVDCMGRNKNVKSYSADDAPMKVRVPSSAPSLSSKSKKPVKAKPDSMKLACMDCKYKFVSKLARPTTRCPYCGGNRFMKDEYTAEKLLSEVSDYTGDDDDRR